VTPLRDFFLLPANYAACRAPLVQRFGELLRKAWNTRNFTGQVGVGIRVGAAPPGKHLPPGRRRAAAQGLGTRARAWGLTTRLALHRCCRMGSRVQQHRRWRQWTVTVKACLHGRTRPAMLGSHSGGGCMGVLLLRRASVVTPAGAPLLQRPLQAHA